MFSCELLITFIASTGPRNKSLTMKDFPHFDLIASETDSKIFKAFRYLTCMLIILQCHQGRQSQNQKVQLFVSRSLKCLCSVLCGLGKKAEIVRVMFHDVTVASKTLSYHMFHHFLCRQKTVVSWQLDTQNASSRSLVSTGKARSKWRCEIVLS